MASLIGIDWPVNSVGVLPDVDHTRPGFLNPRGGEGALARMSLVNTRVLLEHYRIKHGNCHLPLDLDSHLSKNLSRHTFCSINHLVL